MCLSKLSKYYPMQGVNICHATCVTVFTLPNFEHKLMAMQLLQHQPTALAVWKSLCLFVCAFIVRTQTL